MRYTYTVHRGGGYTLTLYHGPIQADQLWFQHAFTAWMQQMRWRVRYRARRR